MQVSVEDPDGVVVLTDSSSVTMAFWANPGSGSLYGGLTAAAANGVATFGNLSINNAGTGYTLAASDGSDAGAISSSFSISPGNPIPISVSTSQPTGTCGTGTTIPIIVSFNRAVMVTGTPQLTLNNGATGNYQSGSGTTGLTFSFTVVVGQNSADLDYASTTALSLNGGTIMDSGNLPAILTLPATGADGLATKNIVVHTGTVIWNYANGGDWDTAANWLGSVLPGATDAVVIPSLTSGSVTHGSSPADTVSSITSNANISLAAGSLTVNGNIQEASGTAVTLAGGTLADATLAGTTTLTLTSGSGTLNAVTIGPGATLDGTYSPSKGYIATANILNGLTLNGVANLGSASGSSSAQLFFIQPGSASPATETLTGSGMATFGASTSNEMLSKGNNAAGPVTLVIDTGVTIQGGSGTLGSYYGNDSFVNNGFIFGNGNDTGGTLTIGGNNQTNGGPNNWTNNGLLYGGGGTVNLSGSFTNASLAEFANSGGIVNVVGFLANTKFGPCARLGELEPCRRLDRGRFDFDRKRLQPDVEQHGSGINSSISGAGGVTKSGTGTATLSGQNSYTGGTSVISGRLLVTNPASLPTGSSLTVGTNAGSFFGAGQAAGALSLVIGEMVAGSKAGNPANASRAEPWWVANAASQICTNPPQNLAATLAARHQFFANYGR